MFKPAPKEERKIYLPQIQYALDPYGRNEVTNERKNIFKRETDQLSEIQDEDLPHFLIDKNASIKQIRV